MMNQFDFDELMKKYLADQCSPEEVQQVLAWSAQLLNDERSPLNNLEQLDTKNRLWAKISRSVLHKSFSWAKMAMAAVLILVLGLGYVFTQPAKKYMSPVSTDLPVSRLKSSSITSEKYTETQNTSAVPLDVRLEDGTVVSLKQNSTLRHPHHFDPKHRNVYLEGGAFFRVKRDIARPFLVHTGALVTQVLGTSFRIDSYPQAKTIEVQVHSGRVSVYEGQEKSLRNRNGVILNPNQKITFDKAIKKLVPELVTTPVMVERPADKTEFMFEETPLLRVVEALQKAYRVEIIVENPTLETCVFTGDLNNLPLHTQLNFICKSVNAHYELRGTTFFMQGDGCLQNSF